jgi:TPR repeat protein
MGMALTRRMRVRCRFTLSLLVCVVWCSRSQAQEPSGLSPEDEAARQGCEAGAMEACNSWARSLEAAGELDHAKSLYELSCDNGNAQGCYWLGNLYANQSPRDYENASRYLAMSCLGFDEHGCDWLGTLWELGQPVQAELDQAREQALASCDGGVIAACHCYATLIANGYGVTQDFVTAALYRQRACDGGVPGACYRLGYQYRDGSGVPADTARTIELWTVACDGGERSACAALHTNEAYAEDPAVEEVRILTEGCDAGQLPLCLHLSENYRVGRGVPIDLARAEALRQRACAELTFLEECQSPSAPPP